MKKLGFFLSILLCFVVILAGCGSKDVKQSSTASKVTDKKERLKISVGMLKLTPSAPIFIGMEKGFFEEENIEIDPQWFDAAQPVSVATAGNKVDVGATGLSASIYNMAALGQKMYIVADKGMEKKDYPATVIMVQKGSSIKSIKDLKGKKIGITQTGGTYHYLLGRALELNGLSLDDVTVTPLGAIGATMETLKSKQVDATLLSEPNVTKAVNDGYGEVLTPLGDELDSQNAAIFLSPEFYGKKDDAVRFMKAYIKACRYYYDAALKLENGKQVKGENFDEVVNIIAEYTGQPAANIEGALPYMDREGKLFKEDIATQIEFYLKNKLIEKEIDAKEITDMKIWEEALKQLYKEEK